MSRPEPFFREAGSGPAVVCTHSNASTSWRDLIVPGMDNIRLALPEDIPACVVLRGRTRENAIPAEHLAAMGITVESWSDDVRSGVLTGFVCTEDRTIVGYCFGDTTSGEVVVLALLPTHEGRGIGRRLLSRVGAHLAEAGHRRLFLGCAADPATRSFGFYRHLGWVSTGTLDPAGDEILELFTPSAEDPANPKEHLDLSYDTHPIRASAGNKYEL